MVDYNNIFLTGATGFLGIHILNEYLINSRAKIYCLISEKKDMSTLEYFNEMLRFYFDESYMTKYKSRIVIIEGDLKEDRFGLSSEQYSTIGNTCDLIIHSGALVKYFGCYSELEEVNVKGTEEVIKLSKRYSIPLSYISTLALAGEVTNNKERTVFSEENFEMGQKYPNNIYIKSKYEAEKRIFKAKEKGLNIVVFRIGLLAARNKDGLFQKNINQNSFYNKIKSIIDSGCIPSDLLNTTLEFTPVDLCSLAIYKILNNEPILNGVYHVYNHNFIKIETLIEYLKEDIEIEVLNDIDFEEYRNKLLISNDSKNLPIAFLLSRHKKYDPEYIHPITISSSKTVDHLKKLNFIWPKVDRQYLHKVINYIKHIGYIS